MKKENVIMLSILAVVIPIICIICSKNKQVIEIEKSNIKYNAYIVKSGYYDYVYESERDGITPEPVQNFIKEKIDEFPIDGQLIETQCKNLEGDKAFPYIDYIDGRIYVFTNQSLNCDLYFGLPE